MKKGFITAAICLGMVSGLFAAEEATKPPAPKASGGTPKIKFDRTMFDFGKTSQVDKVSGIFKFENVGDGVLKLEKPTTSCGCTVAGVKPDVLQPGEKGELAFTLNLPRYKGGLQKQITVVCNDPQTPRTVLSVKAEYVPIYDVTPMSFSLNIRKGNTTNITARVTRTDGKTFKIANLKLSQTNSASWITPTAEPETASTNAVISIALSPQGTPRYFSEALSVYTEESPQPAFSITLYGKIIGDVNLSREMIYWPITNPANAIKSQPITVHSMLSDKFEVKNLNSTLKEVSVEAVPKDDKTFEIVAKLASVPDRSTNGFIQFETNVPSQPKFNVPVTIAVIKPAPAPAAAIKR